MSKVSSIKALYVVYFILHVSACMAIVVYIELENTLRKANCNSNVSNRITDY